MTEDTKNNEVCENDEQNEDKIDLEKLGNFVERMLSMPNVNQLITVHITSKVEHFKWIIIAKTLITLSIVGSGVYLSYTDTFNPTIGVIFGSIVGYILGNRNN